MFNSLWIDKPTASSKVAEMRADERTRQLAERLEHFCREGYVIIEGAVSEDAIDRYLKDFDRLIETRKLKVDAGAGLQDAADVDTSRAAVKFLDIHALSAAAVEICFSPAMLEFLNCIFEEQPLAFQTLHFERGSTQTVHNDTAYVVLNEPKSLTASWVALQDVVPGSGELVYYPGSHRFEEFLYKPHRKHFVHHEDGDLRHQEHLNWIHETARTGGVELKHFLPRKGDVLFWHADLAHGGGPIDDESVTRRSLVTHYCPARCTPHYFRFKDVEDQKKCKTASGGYISSAYYDVVREEQGEPIMRSTMGPAHTPQRNRLRSWLSRYLGDSPQR